MKKTKVLVVTEKFDPHADLVIPEIKRQGGQPIRLHMAHIPDEFNLVLHYDRRNGQKKVKIYKFDAHLEEIKSVWWRRPDALDIKAKMTADQKKFAKMEWQHSLRGVWSLLNCFWVSHPFHIRAASHKPEQLQRAAEFGFDIPRTLITNDPKEVKNFYETCRGNIIYKVMTDPFLGMVEMLIPDNTRDLLKAYKLRFSQKWLRKKTYRVMTTRIDSSHLKQIDTIRTAPCLFQEYIDKKFELRIIVIGDEIFTAEIHSQAHDKTSDDWRDYSVQIPYYKGDLPLTLKEKIHQFVKSYGLNFSALDFILTPDGRYVFLENNPNGQFLWLQSLIPELRLKEAMASCLIKGKFQAG